jgi:ubiquinone/menaquinone biosynthesis C-methylase UbiE
MFTAAETYERLMGRLSRTLAPQFVAFANVREGASVLDVGCGTGSLSAALAEATKAARIVGIDPSEPFVEYARAHNTDPRLTFDFGDAQALPYDDAAFDATLALLVVNFIPDAKKAASEMRRVTRPGGAVATAMWDNTGRNELTNTFWSAALALDPAVKREDLRPGTLGSAEALSGLWAATALRSIETKELNTNCRFSSFDDYWEPRVAEGPTAAYIHTLSQAHKELLQERLRNDIFGSRPDGPFTLDAKAWAVRGIVP